LHLAKRVICLEPDGTSAHKLRLRFAKDPQVVVVEAGVGASPGVLPFLLVEPGSCLNTFSPKWAAKQRKGSEVDAQQKIIEQVTITTIDALIAKHGVPNYIKIDAEGFESEILMGLSHKVPLLSFESNLPEFRDETMACIQRILDISTSACFNYFTCHERPILVEPEWLSGEAMMDYISRAQETFMEIFARYE
jgi:FkbM family methyltransferase